MLIVSMCAGSSTGVDKLVERQASEAKAATGRRWPKRRLAGALQKLIPKLLRDHEAADAAVHDANADAAKLGVQNIGAMAG